MHPGGPFWKGKDAGAWTIPKGLVEEGEDPLAAARREFEEETGMMPPAEAGRYIPLGSVKQKAGKTVHAWAFEGEFDPAELKSNTMPLQWPPKSGKWVRFPEVDEAWWFAPAEAKERINAAQAELVDRLVAALGSSPML